MDPVTGAALISGGASLVGGIMGNSSAKKAAKAANEFSERMANTQHQREVVDLKAAGLNPMLSVMGGHGAAAPTGQIAKTEDVVSPAVNTGLAARNNKAAVDNMRLQNYVLSTQADKNVADAETSRSTAQKIRSENEILQANAPEREVKGQFWDSIKNLVGPLKSEFDGVFSAKEAAQRQKPQIKLKDPHPYKINQDLWSESNKKGYLLPPPSYH